MQRLSEDFEVFNKKTEDLVELNYNLEEELNKVKDDMEDLQEEYTLYKTNHISERNQLVNALKEERNLLSEKESKYFELKNHKFENEKTIVFELKSKKEKLEKEIS